MPVITLHTIINAPPEVVFDLSRSIDLHKISTAHTNEEAIAGRTSGLIQLGETVTWRAKHFGLTQNLTSKITAYNRPFMFTDIMVRGAFQGFTHEHIFEYDTLNARTLMTDVFTYRSPLGVLGSLADALFLKKYMAKLLIERNRIVKEFAEDEGKWRQVI
jgi:ligand-binding SRPBCC domain-containing protein